MSCYDTQQENKISMIEGSQFNAVISFNSELDIDISIPDFVFEVRSRLSNSLLLQFKTSDGSLSKSGDNLILFIPSPLTVGKSGEYLWQLGFYSNSQDMTKLTEGAFEVRKAVLGNEESGSGGNYSPIDPVQITITVTSSDLEITVSPFVIFGGNMRVINLSNADLFPDGVQHGTIIPHGLNGYVGVDYYRIIDGVAQKQSGQWIEGLNTPNANQVKFSAGLLSDMLDTTYTGYLAFTRLAPFL